MLLLFAAWIATGDRAGLPRTALFALGALAVFLCHFYAFAVYAVLVAAFELAEIRRRSPTLSEAFQRLAHAAATLVVPAALLLTAVNPGAHTITAWGTRDDKIRAILSPLTLYLSRPDYLLIVLVLGLLLLARRRGMFAFAPKMAAPVAAVAILAVAMPSQLASVWGADFRLPTILCLLLVAASELRLPSRRAAVAAGGIMTALLLLRTGFVAHDWLRYQADFDELRAADAAIAPGSRVLAMHDLDDHRDPPAPSLFPYRHVAALAVIDRDVFLPHLFAYATPLRFGPPGKAMESDELAVLRRIRWRPRTPAFGATDAATIGQAEEVGRKVAGFDAFSSTFDWSDWPERFDYLIDFDYGAHANPVPALLTEVARGSYFVIYRIHPPA
jgi:hypothetical protein